MSAAPLFVNAAASNYLAGAGIADDRRGHRLAVREWRRRRTCSACRARSGLAPDIGADETPAAPVVVTGAASAVTTTGASVAGAVTPGGPSATWRVEYGTTASYGSTASGAPATGAGFAGEAVAAHAHRPGAGHDLPLPRRGRARVRDGRRRRRDVHDRERSGDGWWCRRPDRAAEVQAHREAAPAAGEGLRLRADVRDQPEARREGQDA